MADHEPGLPTCGNGLLDIAVSHHIFVRDLPKAVVKIRKDQRISFVNDLDRDVYFPINCLFSLRCSIKSGYTAEFNQIGRDGVLGINSLFGDSPGYSEAIALTAGLAYRVRASLVRSNFEASSGFRRTILDYMEAQMREASQRIVCNKHHSITEQLARTLLMASDRLGSQNVGLTHEQLAIAIGCRREAVSISAGQLKSAGIIRYGYGKVTLVDRAALESCSCECYSVIRKGFAKFMLSDVGGAAGGV